MPSRTPLSLTASATSSVMSRTWSPPVVRSCCSRWKTFTARSPPSLTLSGRRIVLDSRTACTRRHAVDAAHREASELVTAERRPSARRVPVRLEQVDERAERRAVSQCGAVHPERHPGQRAEARVAAVTVDPLTHAEQRRKQTAGAANAPESVQLAHLEGVPGSASTYARHGR